MGFCAVALLTVIALAISAQRGMQKSSDVVVAQSYAGEFMEAFVYDLPPLTGPLWTQTSFAAPYLQDQTQLGTKTYQAQLFLQPGTGALSGLLTCTVNVTWNGVAGQGQQRVSISRLVYAP